MKSILKALVLAPVVLAAAAVTANTAMAEATLKVPFSFSVAGKECPAGLYTVEKGLSNSIVTLKSKDTSRSFNWVIGPGDGSKASSLATLKFDQDGDSHSLMQVQYGSYQTGKLIKHSHRTEFVSAPIGQGR